ncbi:MAG: glycosyltransferase family 4 protein [Cyanobacteria bacterium P01_H01_bin.150]
MKCSKILISAYACRPGMGSDPGIGWNTVRELAKYYQVWVVTRVDNRPSIEAEISKNPTSELEFVYFDLPGSNWWKIGLAGVHIHYYLWQVWAYFLGRKLHAEIAFDAVHHVTYVSYTSPSFLSFLPIPFIWGPIGGGESAPNTFWQDFNLNGKIYEKARDFIRWFKGGDPFVKMTAKKSVLAWGMTEDTLRQLQKIGAPKVEVLSPIGLSAEEINRLAQHRIPDASPVRFISIGRLLHWKGFHLGLKAFAKAALIDSEYWIVGDGSERKRLQALAEELGIANQIKFWGKLPREEIFQLLGECHVLVHPSLHESGGFVCMEAMAAARPVICLDLGGPAVQVTNDTGFKIAAHTPEQAIRDLAEAMTCLAKDSNLRISMGEAAQKRAKEVFAWDMKGKFMAQHYEKILISRKLLTSQSVIHT